MSGLPVSKDLKNYVSSENLERKAQGWIAEARAASGRRRQPRWSRGSVLRRSTQFDFSPECAALLVIDMQEYFLNQKSHACLPAGAAISQNVAALISAFRARGLPVIFTRHAVAEGEDAGSMARWWGDVIREGSPMARVVPELAPAQDEDVLRKTQYDAFYGTDLEKILREKGVRRLAICGVMTDLCCETTARSAFVRGFDVFFCADGTATINESLHISALRTLAHGFAEIVSCGEIVQALKCGAGKTHKAAKTPEAPQ